MILGAVLCRSYEKVSERKKRRKEKRISKKEGRYREVKNVPLDGLETGSLSGLRMSRVRTFYVQPDSCWLGRGRLAGIISSIM